MLVYSRYMHVGTWMHVYYIYYGDLSKMYSSTPCLMLCKTECILTFFWNKIVSNNIDKDV